jgi:membrane associated rhomboid family serine protease
MVTVLLIAVNIFVFLMTIAGGTEAYQRIVYEWGVVPSNLLHDKAEIEQPMKLATLFTSLFLHGGLFHLVFNMLFLWLFGDNIEDRLGSFRFLLFYLLCGVAADVTHVALNSSSSMPAIGASGAIAGVMGAYLVLYPRASIRTLIILFPFIRVVNLPALFFLFVWFGIQVLSQLMSWGGESDVAFGAHIGGFVLGMLILSLLKVDDKVIGGRGNVRAPGNWGW